MPLYPLVQWNGSYRLKVYVPAKVRTSLGISDNYYDKRFKTKKEAKEAELQILTDINTIQKGEALPHQAMVFMSGLPFYCIRPTSNSHHSNYQSKSFFYYSVIHHSQNIALIALSSHSFGKYTDSLLLIPLLK